jgi:hypothetical protein
VSRSNTTDQTKQIGKGVDLSSHSFFNAIAEAIKERVARDTGLTLSLQGKKATGKGKISAVLIGQLTDPAKIPEVGDKVRRTMDALKNPTNFLDTLK